MTLEEREDAYREQGNTANQRDPREAPWGYYVTDDCALAAAAVFLWFPSCQDMLAFISEYEGTPGLDEIENGSKREELKALVARLARKLPQKPSELERARKALNKPLASHGRIEWIGTFQDLCNSKSDFCREVRESFLDFDDDDEIGPVSSEQQGEFVEFLRSYGA